MAFFGNSEIDKVISLCRDFCTSEGLRPEDCMSTFPDGSVGFGISYKMQNGKRIIVHFNVLPNRGPNEPNKIVTWSKSALEVLRTFSP